jgi:hypothetical protein
MFKSGHDAMTTPGENNPFEIESQTAYAIYDSESGAIAHIHVITTFRGGEALSVDKHEARALEMARRMGHHNERLRVVKVDHAALDPGKQRIDPKSLALVPDPELTERAKAPIRSRES